MASGTPTPNPKYSTYQRGEGTTTKPKYSTYQRGEGTTTNPKYYNPETGSLTNSPGTITTSTEILRDSQGNPILNSQGETISINEVREKEILQKAAQGKTISQKQQEEIINSQLRNQQIILTQESGRLVKEYTQAINQNFNSLGYKNAEELIKGLNNKEVKIYGNKYKIIVTEKKVTTPFNPPEDNETNIYAPTTTNPAETIKNYNVKSGWYNQPYIKTQNTQRFSEQPASKDIFTQGTTGGKKLYFQNVQSQQFKQDTLSPLIYSTGSLFYGVLQTGESIARTARGNILQNVFLPGTPGSQGFAAETIYSITHPIKTITTGFETLKENPFQLAGQLAGSKAVFDIAAAASPLKIQLNKVEVPTKNGGTKTLIKSVELNAKSPSALKRLAGDLKIVRETKSYGTYIKENPAYAEILKAEIIMPKPGEMEITTETSIIRNSEGKKVIRTTTKETPAQPYSEIDLGTENIDYSGKAYEGLKWDNTLRRFIKKKQPEDSFYPSGGGGGGEGSLLNQLVGRKSKQQYRQYEEQFVYFNPIKEKITSTELKLNPLVINQVNKQIQTNIQAQSTGQKQNQTSIQRQIYTLKSPTIQAQKLMVNQKTINMQSNKQTTRTNQVQTQTQAQVQVQTQAQAQVQTQTQAQRSLTKQITIQKQPIIEITPPPTFPKSKMNFGAASGFNVLIKKAGVWNKVNPQPLTRGEAVNYGAYTIERTPQASFRITPANKPATGRFKAPASLSNFYTKGSTYIEKPSKRINTIGELAGITFKGLNIKRNKLKGWF